MRAPRGGKHRAERIQNILRHGFAAKRDLAQRQFADPRHHQKPPPQGRRGRQMRAAVPGQFRDLFRQRARNIRRDQTAAPDQRLQHNLQTCEPGRVVQQAPHRKRGRHPCGIEPVDRAREALQRVRHDLGQAGGARGGHQPCGGHLRGDTRRRALGLSRCTRLQHRLRGQYRERSPRIAPRIALQIGAVADDPGAARRLRQIGNNLRRLRMGHQQQRPGHTVQRHEQVDQQCGVGKAQRDPVSRPDACAGPQPGRRPPAGAVPDHARRAAGPAGDARPQTGHLPGPRSPADPRICPGFLDLSGRLIYLD